MPENSLKHIVEYQKAGNPVGIYSACSSNSFFTNTFYIVILK